MVLYQGYTHRKVHPREQLITRYLLVLGLLEENPVFIEVQALAIRALWV